MIRSYRVAKTLHEALSVGERVIHDGLEKVWNDLSPGEQERCREAIAHVLASIMLDAMRPLERMHPTLVPDDRKDDYA